MKKFTSTLFIIFLIFSAKALAADNDMVKRISEGRRKC